MIHLQHFCKKYLQHFTLMNYHGGAEYFVTQLCLTLWQTYEPNPPGSSVHGIFPGEVTGVGCHFLLQGLFPTLGLNLCLLHLQYLAGKFFTTEPPRKPMNSHRESIIYAQISCCGESFL